MVLIPTPLNQALSKTVLAFFGCCEAFSLKRGCPTPKEDILINSSQLGVQVKLKITWNQNHHYDEWTSKNACRGMAVISLFLYLCWPIKPEKKLTVFRCLISWSQVQEILVVCVWNVQTFLLLKTFPGWRFWSVAIFTSSFNPLSNNLLSICLPRCFSCWVFQYNGILPKPFLNRNFQTATVHYLENFPQNTEPHSIGV